MKNNSFYLSLAAIVAVAVLYILFFTVNPKSGKSSSAVAVERSDERIAYVNMDSLLTNYDQYKALSEAFLKKVENAQAELTIRGKQLEKEIQDFQTKVQNNGFLTRERAENAQTELMVKQERFERDRQDMAEKFAREEAEMNTTIYNAVTSFMAEYAVAKGYEIILSNTTGSTVLYALPAYNVTAEVVEQLNARYAK